MRCFRLNILNVDFTDLQLLQTVAKKKSGGRENVEFSMAPGSYYHFWYIFENL